MARSVIPCSSGATRLLMAWLRQQLSYVNIQPAAGGTPGRLMGALSNINSCTAPGVLVLGVSVAQLIVGPKPLHCGDISVCDTNVRAMLVTVGWLCTLNATGWARATPLQSRYMRIVKRYWPPPTQAHVISPPHKVAAHCVARKHYQ